MLTVFMIAERFYRIITWTALGLAAFCLQGARKAQAAITYTFSSNKLTVTGSSNNDTIRVYADGSGAAKLEYKEGSGSLTTVTVTADAMNVHEISIVGGLGADSIGLQDVTSADFDPFYLNTGGGNGGITLKGEGGNDSIKGSAFEDSILGGDTGDSVFAGLGDDTILGGDGGDAIYGEAGNDSILGGGGNDSIFGSTGFDTLIGNTGQDSLMGEADDDRLEGGNDGDTLVGDVGNDVLLGDSGADSLVGGSGSDTVYHDDIVTGSSSDGSQDTLWGNAPPNGNDVGDVIVRNTASDNDLLNP